MASYIYVLRCPKTGAVRYIGKTANLRQRLHDHMNNACTKGAANHRACWIRKLVREGVKPEIVALFHVPDGMSWQIAEQFFIAAGRVFSFALLNETTGGDGGMHNDSSRKKLSETRKRLCQDPDVRKRISEAAKRSHAKPEFRQRQSDSAKRRLGRPGARARQSEAMRAWFAKPGNMERHKARLADPEVKERFAIAAKRRMADPTIKAKMSTKIKAAFATPEGKIAHDRCVRQWTDPAAKKRRMEKSTATRARNAGRPDTSHIQQLTDEEWRAYLSQKLMDAISAAFAELPTLPRRQARLEF